MSIRFVVVVAISFSSLVSMACGDQNQELRSAFLGPQQWGQQLLSPSQINGQLRQHFEQVLLQLNAQTNHSLDIAVQRAEAHAGSPWTNQQRCAVRTNLARLRQQQLETLRSYAGRGLFPLNEGQADHAVPIFVDGHGTHCAVGYLMHRSGADYAVRAVVDSNNLVVVTDVNNGPLVDWILASGLTQEEAALIQPAYQPPAFQATLADFAAPGMSVSGHGMTITNFSAERVSYFSPSFSQGYAFGRASLSAGLGMSFDQPESIGLTIGRGEHQAYPDDDYSYDGCPCWGPAAGDEWVFIGSSDSSGLPTGPIAAGDNATMFQFTYDVTMDATAELFALSSSGFFNFNYNFYGNDSIGIRSSLAGQVVELVASEFLTIDGVETMTIDGASFRVVTEGLIYRRDDQGEGQITSFFHEWDVVPEPSPFSVVVGLACSLVFGRRRPRRRR